MSRNDHPQGAVLQAYVDGELAPAQSAEVAEHCQACLDCRQELASIHAVQAQLALAAGPGAPRPVWPAVAARLARDRRPLGAAFTLGAAAACTAGIVLGIVIARAPGGAQASAENWIRTSPEALWRSDGGASLLDVFAPAAPEES